MEKFEVIDLYKHVRTSGELFPTSTNFDFWDLVYTPNKSVLDREFARKYSHFRYFDFLGAETISDAVDNFKSDVLSILTFNQKRYEEMYRVFLVTDEDDPITYNYDMTETTGAQKRKFTKGAQENISGSRQDTYGAQENQYGARSHTYGAQENQYGARSHTYGAQENQYGAQDHTYGAQTHTKGSQENQYGAQSNTTGAQQTTNGQRSDTVGAGETTHSVAPFNSSTVSVPEYTDTTAQRTDITGAQTIDVGARTDSVGAHTDTEGQRVDTEAQHIDTTGAHTDTLGAHTDSDTAYTDTLGAHTDSDTAHTDTLGSHTDTIGNQTMTEGQRVDNEESDAWTLTRKGNIGTQTAADILRLHSEYWTETYKFFGLIFEDICKQLLLIGDC